LDANNPLLCCARGDCLLAVHPTHWCQGGQNMSGYEIARQYFEHFAKLPDHLDATLRRAMPCFHSTVPSRPSSFLFQALREAWHAYEAEGVVSVIAEWKVSFWQEEYDAYNDTQVWRHKLSGA